MNEYLVKVVGIDGLDILYRSCLIHLRIVSRRIIEWRQWICKIMGAVKASGRIVDTGAGIIANKHMCGLRYFATHSREISRRSGAVLHACGRTLSDGCLCQSQMSNEKPFVSLLFACVIVSNQ